MNRKDIKWVDIDGGCKKQEVKFTPLMTESIVETPTSKPLPKTNENLKDNILATTLYGLVRKQYPRGIFVEGTENKSFTEGKGGKRDKTETLYSTSQWHEFEEHARVILTFLNTNSDQADKTIQKLRKMFQDLGDGNESQGLQLFDRLNVYIKECGGDNTQPKLTADLLLAQWSAEEIKSLFALFNAVENSKNGRLLPVLQKVSQIEGKMTTLNQLINGAYSGNELEGLMDENIITKLTRFTKVKKRTAVGQGEILFAILFKDCALGNSGDIDCYSSGSVKEGGQIVPVEMKSNSAGPDDVGCVKVEDMLPACGYEQVTKTGDENAFNRGYKEIKTQWVRKQDNLTENMRKQKEDIKVPSVDLRTIASRYRKRAFNLLRKVWSAYIDKVNGHGGENSTGYILFIRPGSDSAQVKDWINKNLLIIKTVDDIIYAFDKGYMNIRAQTIQGNEFMTFKLEVAIK